MINTIQQNNSILNVNLMKGSQQKTALIDNLVIQNNIINSFSNNDVFNTKEIPVLTETAFNNFTNLDMLYLSSATISAPLNIFHIISSYVERRHNKQEPNAVIFIASGLPVIIAITAGIFSIITTSIITVPITLSLAAGVALIRLSLDSKHKIHYAKIHYLKKKIGEVWKETKSLFKVDSKLGDINTNSLNCIKFRLITIKSIIIKIESAKKNKNKNNNKDKEKYSKLSKINQKVIKKKMAEDYKAKKSDRYLQIFRELTQLLILISGLVKECKSKDIKKQLELMMYEIIKIMINQNYHINVLNDLKLIVSFINTISPPVQNSNSMTNEIIQSILPQDFNSVRNSYDHFINLNNEKIYSDQTWGVLIAKALGLGSCIHCCSSDEKKNLQADILKEIPHIINFYTFFCEVLFKKMIELQTVSNLLNNQEIKGNYDIVIKFFLESIRLFEKKLYFYGVTIDKPTNNLQDVNLRFTNGLDGLYQECF